MVIKLVFKRTAANKRSNKNAVTTHNSVIKLNYLQIIWPLILYNRS